MDTDHHHPMATVQRRTDNGTRLSRRALADVGEEIRRARLANGTSQMLVGRAVGRSRNFVSRIERAAAPNASVRDLARLGSAVGLDIVVRAYPGGPPVRDRAHLLLLERLRARLHPSLRWRTEMPLNRPGDQRAWDAVITGAGPPIMVEAETRIVDVQALERRIALKVRDDGTDRVILLIGNTRTNRSAIHAAGQGFLAMFPGDGRRALKSLAEGIDPGGGALIAL